MYRQGKEFQGAWNFGPNDPDIITVERIVSQSISQWKKGKYKVDKGNHPHEAKLLKLDISKSRFKLRWEPVYDVNKAINETIKWYKKYYDGKSMAHITNKQLEEYVITSSKRNIDWTKK